MIGSELGVNLGTDYSNIGLLQFRTLAHRRGGLAWTQFSLLRYFIFFYYGACMLRGNGRRHLFGDYTGGCIRRQGPPLMVEELAGVVKCSGACEEVAHDLIVLVYQVALGGENNVTIERTNAIWWCGDRGV